MISHSEVVLRLLTAAALGSVIGFDRERLRWTAGIRTHMLVSVGACLLMIVSAYGFSNAIEMPHVVLDPSRIAAQVVSGIGFLGAGAILMKGNIVRGLTTAASIWAVAALGLAAGGGLYFAAVVATIVILIILAGIKPIEEAYRSRIQSCTVRISAEQKAISISELKRALGVAGRQIRRLTQTIGENGHDDVTIQLVRVSPAEIRVSLTRLKALPGIHAAEIEQKRPRPAREDRDPDDDDGSF